MSKRNSYSVFGLLIILFAIWFFTDSNREKEAFNDKVKVTLRNVGHEILLSSNDSTSLVLPILKLEEQKYEITFKTDLSFEPRILVSIVQNSFDKADFLNNYLVEVIQCSDNEVAYSFEMLFDKEKSIIPCQGRILPLNCYSITVKFIDKDTLIPTQKYLYGLSILGFIILQLMFYKRKKDAIANDNSKIEEALNKNYASIGVYQFYPDQNKLVREATEINLSKKECELLSIFIASPNQIIKRDELTKRVWEDHGVFVGRSLDTYISKLRKKLKDDTSIKITNVHGVGYKLEIVS